MMPQYINFCYMSDMYKNLKKRSKDRSYITYREGMDKTRTINLHWYYNKDRIKNAYDITAEVYQLCYSQKTNKNLINIVPGY
jgi:hypothetical protein